MIDRSLFYCLWPALALGWIGLGGAALAAEAGVASPYALLVGGGPDVESNAVQIEGHVRFVASLLSRSAKRVILFADGKTDQPTVSYADTGPAADAQRALAILLADPEAGEPTLTRPPKLDAPPDGPARLQVLRRDLTRLCLQAVKQPAPLLLYFAGHGTQDEKNEQNTQYDLWDGDKLTVRDLAEELARAPRQVPVIVVMAQCFSGAFANLLFKHANPEEPLIEQNLVGFFSARKDREAAGCSYTTDRADYQDFSSYFFGALCGQDRFGGAVSGADYDGDGHVSLHEAFCYALIHNSSADTPICTSDVFLMHKASLSNATVYGTPYHEVWQAGTPAQRAALDALSAQLELDGETRAIAAFDRLTFSDSAARPALVKSQSEAKERLAAVRQRELAPLFAHWPALRWLDDASDDYKKAFDGVVDALTDNEALRRALLTADKAHAEADGAVENEEAALMRFTTLYEHVVEAHQLREHGKAEIKAQFERLWQAEQGGLPLTIPR